MSAKKQEQLFCTILFALLLVILAASGLHFGAVMGVW